MGKILAVICLVCSVCLTKAAIIADWTFETSQPSGTAATIGPLNAEGGINAGSISQASGVHASSSTVWSNPQGDTSANSFSADHWAVGDYFQFKTTTVGYSQIIISFEQISSSTGPTEFKLAYSTDGTTFVDVSGGSYTVVNPASINWATGGSLKPSTESFDLSSITAVNNDTTIYFRLIDTTTPGGSTGTSRVDDFEIQAVPEPPEWGAISALGLLGICGLREWRQRRCGEKLKSCPVK